MNSCGRWHSLDCSEPTIITDDGVPRCLSCGTSSAALVAKLVTKNYPAAGDIHLPVAAPLGEADFWWPPCVPYRGTRVDTKRTSEASDARAGSSNLSVTGAWLNSVSPIYTSSLDSNHFRLISLAEVNDISSPIHIKLEEYAIDDCPEYETISYLWGGEEGDSTLCKPVYVGIFWDIILVTKNCSAVLHYLRPGRGSRFIWLDAICINQADESEKPAQISKMGDIYTNCERVVAYFGNDLVSQPLERKCRQRINFQQSAFFSGMNPDSEESSAEFLKTCSKSAGLSQDQLLQRRYLTRIWIVQELLLSKKAIFPLGYSDVICDGKETVHLLLRADKEQLRMSGVDGKSLSHLLKATSHCQASDPRDKIFGLLGLFQPQDSSRNLIPNYSLSWRDCWVGTSAYILLVEGNLLLLTHSVGDNDKCLPSWALDIQNADRWDVDLTSILHRVSRAHDKSDTASPISTSCIRGSGRLDSSDLRDHLSSDSDSPSEDDSEYNNHNRSGSRVVEPDNWGADIVMYSLDAEENRPHESRRPSQRRPAANLRLVFDEGLCTLSMKEVSINSSDGALQLEALRVFDGPCQLTVSPEGGGLASISVHGSSTKACFRVMGLRESLPLDESYQFFIISCQDLDFSPNLNEDGPRKPDVFLLALTTMFPGNDPTLFKLHDCCTIYNIHLFTRDHPLEIPPLYAGFFQITEQLHSLHWILHNLHEVVLNSYHAVDSESNLDWVLPCVFPSLEARTQDILELMILLSDSRSPYDALERELVAAAETICPDFDPFILDDMFYLTANDRELLMLLRSIWEPQISTLSDGNVEQLNLPRMPEIKYSRGWRREKDGSVYGSYTPRQNSWTGLSFHRQWGEYDWHSLWSGTTFPVQVRFSVYDLLECLERTTSCEAMRHAREYCSGRHEDLDNFVHRRPRPEDRCTFSQDWYPSLAEELNLAWKFERLTIV